MLMDNVLDREHVLMTQYCTVSLNVLLEMFKVKLIAA